MDKTRIKDWIGGAVVGAIGTFAIDASLAAVDKGLSATHSHNSMTQTLREEHQITREILIQQIVNHSHQEN